MFYRLLGRIFFLFWVAPAISKLIREILYPASREGFMRVLVKENEERRKKERVDYKSRLLLREPAEWELLEGLKITQAVGWDEGDDPKSWDERITRREFYERAALSDVERAPRVDRVGTE